MSKRLFLFAAALPLGVTLLCWVSMRTLVTAGTESMRLYGFPLGWVAPSPAASMAFDVAAGPLVVDLLVHAAIAWGLVAASGLARAPAAPRRLAIAGLWVLALGSLAYCVAPLLTDAHVVAWTLDGYFGDQATRAHALQLGPPAWGG